MSPLSVSDVWDSPFALASSSLPPTSVFLKATPTSVKTRKRNESIEKGVCVRDSWWGLEAAAKVLRLSLRVCVASFCVCTTYATQSTLGVTYGYSGQCSFVERDRGKAALWFSLLYRGVDGAVRRGVPVSDSHTELSILFNHNASAPFDGNQHTRTLTPRLTAPENKKQAWCEQKKKARVCVHMDVCISKETAAEQPTMHSGQARWSGRKEGGTEKGCR